MLLYLFIRFYSSAVVKRKNPAQLTYEEFLQVPVSGKTKVFIDTGPLSTDKNWLYSK